ncbi:DUF6371 domain-containing protein [Elizabethkingia anophelis]|uniref:DUF6965 family protein n=1 Tax=Elizabethkingia anophelis TaxID=1117645 RepID=UPI0035577D3C
METLYRFILEKGSRKYHCPNCRKKTFVRYIDTKAQDYLPEEYGRCDRESKCGYYLNPYQDGYRTIEQKGQSENNGNNYRYNKSGFKSQPLLLQYNKHYNGITKSNTKPVFIPDEVFKRTLKSQQYEKNVFIQNLFYNIKFPFSTDEVTKVIELYRLGTIGKGYREGAITFPFIDEDNKVRAIQVKEFDKNNRTTGTDFLHSIIEKHYLQDKKPLPQWLEDYNKQDKKVSCLFGENILRKYPLHPIALVEAPKTAIYGTLYFGLPELLEPINERRKTFSSSPSYSSFLMGNANFIWLAVYNKSSFSYDKLKVLKGRDIYVFADLSKDGNTFNEWKTKAKEFEKQLPNTRFVFSDLLEVLAPEKDKTEGYDLADYLIQLDWRLFRQSNEELRTQDSHNQKRQRQENRNEKEPKLKIPELQELEEKKPINGNQPEQDFQSSKQKGVAGCSSALEKTKIFLANQQSTSSDVHGSFESKSEELGVKIPNKNRHNINTDNYIRKWDQEISELELFFSSIIVPNLPIKLNECSTISDTPEFIKNHLSIVKANNGKPIFQPYLIRLQQLKQILTIETSII